MQVLIADNNVELCAAVAEYLNAQPDMCVAGIAYNGEEALSLICSLQPDVLVLDITMPHLDGMAVLERLGAQGLAKNPVVIMLTALGREDIIQRFLDLGAHYYILKPFDLDVLVERIRQFALPGPSTPNAENRNRYHASASHAEEAKITHILQMMGVPPHLKGFQYMREAVLMILKNEQLIIGPLTKELYPRLAEKYDSTPAGVEGAIRNAALAAWENGNREYISNIMDSKRVERFPTNSLLLSKLADAVRLNQR